MNRSPMAAHRSLATFIVLCAAWSVLAGCAHVTLISSYDEATDKGVTAIHAKVDTLVNQLDVDPTPAYASLKSSYDAIHSDVASLRLRNEARAKNELTVRQIDELRTVLGTLEGQHKNGTLNQPMVGPSREAFDRTFRAILKLELAKKELK